VHKPYTIPIELLVPSSVSTKGWSEFGGPPRQHLLVSTPQATGLDVDHVEVSRTQGQRGDKVNLRGSIPSLV
jgi:hypothetical protein